MASPWNPIPKFDDIEPVPQAVLDLPDAMIRTKAVEVWNAACRFEKAIHFYRQWFDRFARGRISSDVVGASGAVICGAEIENCIQIILAAGVVSNGFDDKSAEELIAMMPPRVPSGISDGWEKEPRLMNEWNDPYRQKEIAWLSGYAAVLIDRLRQYPAVVMAGKPLKPPSATAIKPQNSITLRTLCDALACLEKNEIPANYIVSSGQPQGWYLQKHPIIFDRKPLEAKPGFKELRTFVQREWDQKLIASNAERLIGELLRRGHFSDISEAEAVSMEEAAELLNDCSPSAADTIDLSDKNPLSLSPLQSEGGVGDCGDSHSIQFEPSAASVPRRNVVTPWDDQLEKQRERSIKELEEFRRNNDAYMRHLKGVSKLNYSWYWFCNRRPLSAALPERDAEIEKCIDDLMNIGKELIALDELPNVSKWAKTQGQAANVVEKIIEQAAAGNREEVGGYFEKFVLDQSAHTPSLESYEPDDLTAVYALLATSLPTFLNVPFTCSDPSFEDARQHAINMLKSRVDSGSMVVYRRHFEETLRTVNSLKHQARIILDLEAQGLLIRKPQQDAKPGTILAKIRPQFGPSAWDIGPAITDLYDNDPASAEVTTKPKVNNRVPKPKKEHRESLKAYTDFMAKATGRRTREQFHSFARIKHGITVPADFWAWVKNSYERSLRNRVTE